MFLAADGILIKSTMGGFVILGSKLLGKFYDKVSKIFVSKWDCFKIHNEVVLHTWALNEQDNLIAMGSFFKKTLAPIGYLLILNSIYLINLENRESQMREKT